MALIALPDESTSATPEQRLAENWREIRQAIASEADVLAQCHVDAPHCTSIGAKRFLTIVAAARSRVGRARLGEVNRAVNLAIRPNRGLVHDRGTERWTAPIDTLTRGAGDCEDYAIAKFAALRAVGIDEEHLRLMIVRDVVLREDHAVLTAELDGRWLILDNRHMAMIEMTQAKQYVPLFALGVDGIRRVDVDGSRGSTGTTPGRH
jgi:predicted transglutaminase-like cysteine proteinase